MATRVRAAIERTTVDSKFLIRLYLQQDGAAEALQSGTPALTLAQVLESVRAYITGMAGAATIGSIDVIVRVP
jgi:hypothetical protein